MVMFNHVFIVCLISTLSWCLMLVKNIIMTLIILPVLSRCFSNISKCLMLTNHIVKTRKRFRDCSLRVFALGMQASRQIKIKILII